ncbi:MAG: 4-alpha-glucanotransferase [Rhodobacteraceae bacterium]|nr:4-alpha-glucanotransferase [Paracoccaceae bacterium]
MTENPLHALAEAKGILAVFHDQAGNAHWTSDDTRRALLRAMGIPAETETAAQQSLDAHRAEAARRIAPLEYVVVAQHPAGIPVTRPCVWVLVDEAGAEVGSGMADGLVSLPPLETGVYWLHLTAGDEEQATLVPAAPEKLPTIAPQTGMDRIWGATAALYGLRSARNLGVGDYSDLRCLAETFGDAGASFVGINPIHNWGWASPDTASPYSPSHRGFLNTVHIAADNIPGLAGNEDAETLVGQVRAGIDRDATMVNYSAHAARQKPLLRNLFVLFKNAAREDHKAAFAAHRQSGGEQLRRFATYEALSAIHGGNWHSWPAELRDPETIPANAVGADDLEFHAWLQWVATVQLMEAASASRMPLGLYLDLAVGARRDGAEAWMEQGSVAQGVSIGAPPDQLGPDGQNWQLTAFTPAGSASSGYRNFRYVLRQTMQAASVLRIDHILGLNRSFWIADDGSPGAYVQQSLTTLLALVRIEAHRANCIVVGEDLGLVPDGFRETLAAGGFYGYSVLQFEKEGDGSFRDPGRLRAQSLACFATHDTPTLHGYCAGRDIFWWHRLGSIDSGQADWYYGARRAEIAALVPAGSQPGPAIHARLAYSPVAMIAVQLDDVLGEIEAQNLPGTIDEHPNWRRIYTVAVTDLDDEPALDELAQMMRNAGRASGNPQGKD